MVIIRYILTALAGLILAAVVVWVFRQCWKDMIEILDSLDETDEKEKAD